MLDILHFIDSPDVRAFNQDTQFAPIEQAAIIYHSNRSVEVKLAAWRELLDTYSEEAFAAGNICGGWFFTGGVSEEFTHRDIVIDLIIYHETALELRNIQEPTVIYMLEIASPAQHREEPFPDIQYFSDYHKAENHLQDTIRIRKENQEQDILYANIKVLYLDQSDDKFAAAYHFDQDGILFDVWLRHGIAPTVHDGDCHILNTALYVPIPFENGDLVKYMVGGEMRYGVLVDDAATREQRPLAHMAWAFDYEVERYVLDEGKWVFDYDDSVHATSLERCAEEELPENQQMLKCLRDAIRGDVHYLHFLYCYSRSGDKLPQEKWW